MALWISSINGGMSFFYSLIHDIGIKLKVAMGYMIAHPYNCMTWNLREMGFEKIGQYPINAIDSFSYRCNKGAVRCKELHAVRRRIIIFG